MLRHGFLNIDVTEDGTKLEGIFYDTSGGIINDQFTIKKNLDKDF